MIDRKKVIKGLECCTSAGFTPECENCPYCDNPDDGTCVSLHKMLSDALTLLKEDMTIISQYHRADAFLATHGWRWDNETL